MQCVEDQLTVRLPRDLSEALNRAARQMDRKNAEVVRMALRAFLRVDAEETAPAERVRGLLGSLDTGTPDLAERHREYVLESLEREG